MRQPRRFVTSASALASVQSTSMDATLSMHGNRRGLHTRHAEHMPRVSLDVLDMASG